MRMNELTENERDILDKLSTINLKLIKDEVQSLWNVCWGYLNNKFNSSLIQESEDTIIETLKELNAIAPMVKHSDNKIAVPEVPKKKIIQKKSAMSTLF